MGVLAEAAAPQRDKHQTAARGGGGGCLRRGRVGAKQAQVWQQGAGGSAAGGCVWRCGFCRAVHHDPSITCQHLNNVPHTPQGSPWDAHPPPHTHTGPPKPLQPPPPPHTPDHDAAEVDGSQCKGEQEQLRVTHRLEAKVEPRGRGKDQQVHVKHIGGPCGRLVLRDRGNDGDVLLGISGVKQRPEAARPGGHLACRHRGACVCGFGEGGGVCVCD